MGIPYESKKLAVFLNKATADEFENIAKKEHIWKSCEGSKRFCAE